jgi:hypothetical protein
MLSQKPNRLPDLTIKHTDWKGSPTRCEYETYIKNRTHEIREWIMPEGSKFEAPGWLEVGMDLAVWTEKGMFGGHMQYDWVYVEPLTMEHYKTNPIPRATPLKEIGSIFDSLFVIKGNK